MTGASWLAPYWVANVAVVALYFYFRSVVRAHSSLSFPSDYFPEYGLTREGELWAIATLAALVRARKAHSRAEAVSNLIWWWKMVGLLCLGWANRVTGLQYAVILVGT